MGVILVFILGSNFSILQHALGFVIFLLLGAGQLGRMMVYAAHRLGVSLAEQARLCLRGSRLIGRARETKLQPVAASEIMFLCSPHGTSRIR